MIMEPTELNLISCLREVPGKRMVYRAHWKNNPVIVKIFIHKNSAKRHWLRDIKGINAFTEKNILSPALLWSGKMPSMDSLKLPEQSYGIILEEVQNAESLLEVWNKSSNKNKKRLIKDMYKVIASHHNKGLLQTDLHLGNFLLSTDRIYSIDGDALEIHEGQTPLDKAAENLALLVSQTEVAATEFFVESLPTYLAETSYGPSFENIFKESIIKTRELRCQRYLKKVFRSCTAISFSKSKGRKVWLNNKYHTDDMTTYCKHPEALFPKAPEDLLKNGNSATVAQVNLKELSLVVKRYNYHKNIKTFVRRFRTSRAAKSWKNAHMLLNYGLKTPQPVALIEAYSGPAIRSAYYLSLFEKGSDALTYFTDSAISFDEKEKMAAKINLIFKVFQTCRISHGDCKATNFLIVDNEISIIDLDSMQKHDSARTFKKAFVKDCRRWQKNWRDYPEIAKIFNNNG